PARFGDSSARWFCFACPGLFPATRVYFVRGTDFAAHAANASVVAFVLVSGVAARAERADPSDPGSHRGPRADRFGGIGGWSGRELCDLLLPNASENRGGAGHFAQPPREAATKARTPAIRRLAHYGRGPLQSAHARTQPPASGDLLFLPGS